MSIDWTEYFGELLEVIKKKSKDPSTKVSAIITDEHMAIVSTGFNGFPKGVKDDSERYNNRELKYKIICHAEMNAILLAARRGTKIEDCTLWINRFPCCECAKAIIQSGIKLIIIIDKENNQEFRERWAESMKLAQEMFDEAKVKIDWR